MPGSTRPSLVRLSQTARVINPLPIRSVPHDAEIIPGTPINPHVVR